MRFVKIPKRDSSAHGFRNLKNACSVHGQNPGTGEISRVMKRNILETHAFSISDISIRKYRAEISIAR